MRKLPSNIQAEQCVLSAMMLDISECGYACAELSTEHFTKKGDQLIFECLIEMYNRNDPVDVVTVMEYLKNRNQVDLAGGVRYINDLSDVVLSTANIEYHSNILIKKWKLRKTINESNNTIENCYDDPENPDKLINNAVTKLMKITKSSGDRFFVNPLNSNKKALKEISDSMNSTHRLLKMDISELDNYVQLRPGTLMIIKADTSVGKTVLGMQVAFSNIANRGKVGLIVTGEMAETELLMREYARHTGIPAWRIFSGKIGTEELEKINNYAEFLTACKYQIAVGSLSIQEIRRRVQQVIHKYGLIDFIIIDYLQKMKPVLNEKREREIAGLSSGCKDLAMEFECPVIAMSQVNSSGQARESRGIEQDTDIEMYLRRPEKEGFEEYERINGDTSAPTEEDAFVKITKNRKGKRGTIELTFVGDRQCFIGWEEHE